jgi:hypothetical protein
MRVILLFLNTIGIFCISCDPTSPMEESWQASVNIHISHSVGAQELYYDSVCYTNAKKENYSISRLQYYLSDIHFYKDGKLQYFWNHTLYIDAFKEQPNIFLGNISPFTYDSISYLIGVPAVRNQHGMLPSTYENLAMEWPDIMGGGYHFIKLEGHWRAANDISGYAIHLGTLPCIVQGSISVKGTFTAGENHVLTLHMDINEWFQHPYAYSFEHDGVYTMGDSLLMNLIAINGKDVLQPSY